MRKRIKTTGFADWDTMFYNNLLSVPVLAVFSIVAEDWGSENLNRNLYVAYSSTRPRLTILVAHQKHVTSCCSLLHSQERPP